MLEVRIFWVNAATERLCSSAQHGQNRKAHTGYWWLDPRLPQPPRVGFSSSQISQYQAVCQQHRIPFFLPLINLFDFPHVGNLAVV